MITLSAIVVRNVALEKRESAFEARDRLWRSVDVHDHEPLVVNGIARCVMCSAVVMAAVS